LVPTRQADKGNGKGHDRKKHPTGVEGRMEDEVPEDERKEEADYRREGNAATTNNGPIRDKDSHH
jgi:hypothetical protein